jgi:nitroreductase
MAFNVVEETIAGRASVRGFLPTAVPRALVERILEVSARAPSGTNMQPWRAYAVTGAPKMRLQEALLAAHDEPAGTYTSEYRYYPEIFPEPYLSRRRKVGWDLYGRLGIARGDSARMHAQHARNFIFFGAPVGLFFTIDRRLEIGSWLDYGCFLENVMLAARSHGLETCPQAAFAPFHAVIRRHITITDTEVVVCGMALGYPDPHEPANGLVTERAPATDFTTFLGWDDPAGQ